MLWLFSTLRIESVHLSCTQFFLYVTHFIFCSDGRPCCHGRGWGRMRALGVPPLGGFSLHFVGRYECRGMRVRGDGSYSVPSAHDSPSTPSTPRVSSLGDQGYGSPSCWHLGDCLRKGAHHLLWAAPRGGHLGSHWLVPCCPGRWSHVAWQGAAHGLPSGLSRSGDHPDLCAVHECTLLSLGSFESGACVGHWACSGLLHDDRHKGWADSGAFRGSWG
jgi:hypothetical protein